MNRIASERSNAGIGALSTLWLGFAEGFGGP